MKTKFEWGLTDMKRNYVEFGGGYVIYQDVGKITDVEVANLVRKHTRLIDRLSVEKMTCFALYAQNMLMGVMEKPKGDKWLFKYLKQYRND